MKKSFIVLHHSLVRYDGRPQVKGFNNTHKDRGFPKSSLGYYVGYHYVVEGDGSVVQTRKDEEIGAHCKEAWKNYNSIGICLSGNFDIDDPTQEQIESLSKLLHDLQKKHGIENKNVRLHRDYATYKSCPGTRIPNDILFYIENHRKKAEVSEWAKKSVEKAIEHGIAKEWNTPQEIVGNSVLEHILCNLKLLNDVQGSVTKERLIVALDRAKLLKK